MLKFGIFNGLLLKGFKIYVYRCLDIDECEEKIHKCSHLCENNIGSYVCSCRLGFRLINDFECGGESCLPTTVLIYKDP